MKSDPDAWIRHAMKNFDVWCRTSSGSSGDVYFSPDPHDIKKGIYVILKPNYVATGRFEILVCVGRLPTWDIPEHTKITPTTEWNPAIHTPSNKYEFAMGEQLELTFLAKRMLVLFLNDKNYTKVQDIALGEALYG
jgi:hypothetical protein